MHIRIKDIPLHERPVERLKKLGSEYLSDEELLAIVLKTGTKEKSVKDLARLLISKTEGLNNIGKYSFEELKQIKGIGDKKASLIIAICEITKRINKKTDTKKIKLNSPEIVYNHFKSYFQEIKQEEFHCIFLDNAKNLIKTKMLFKGTINQSLIHPREIFKEAYKASASSIICVHNHPSGGTTPSLNDIEVTKKINELGKLFDIKLIDHIIIGDGYYSFSEKTDIL